MSQHSRQLFNTRYSRYKFLLIIIVNLYQQAAQMQFTISIKYFHPILQIGLEDVRNAWLFSDNDKTPVPLKTVIHQGHLHYRLPISGKRISYRSLKKGLIRKSIIVQLPLQLLPF